MLLFGDHSQLSPSMVPGIYKCLLQFTLISPRILDFLGKKKMGNKCFTNSLECKLLSKH